MASYWSEKTYLLCTNCVAIEDLPTPPMVVVVVVVRESRKGEG